MNLTIKVGPTPRVYVERIDITGNTSTRDKVIRREFRLNEGDAFNALRVKRSQDRVQSLGYFQDKLEIKQTEGSAPDRVVLGLNLEEKPTGQLSLSGGYSSLEKFVVQLAVSQNNFMGKGQSLDASVNWSVYSKSVSLGFTDPYFLDKPILFGANIFRQDYRNFNYIGTSRNTTYSQVTTGGALRMGFPITEYWSFGGRYTLQTDRISLDPATFYTDPDGTGPLPAACDPLKAGIYLCDELGKRLTSVFGFSTVYDDTDGVRPTRGQRLTWSEDFAGLGGDVKYLRSSLNATKFKSIGGGWIVSAHGEGGYVAPLQKAPQPGVDAIRLTDRFFDIGIRGFDIRGIGPRVQRVAYKDDGTLDPTQAVTTDAIGGRAYYMGRLELQFPTSAGLKSLGLRPSAYIDAGSIFKITTPPLIDILATCSLAATDTTPADIKVIRPGDPVACPTGYTRTDGFKEFFVGNSSKPRLSIGIGVNWVSPFGPLRIDIAKALLKQRGDETKLFSFNVGTQF
jgi:outer membrane protein insertion porin family